MDLLEFVFYVIAVTASGALAPGPLVFGVLMRGSKEGARGGFSAAVGHTIVELPLILALAFGLLAAASQLTVRNVIGLVGGVGLIGFGVFQVYETIRGKAHRVEMPKVRRLPASSLLLGVGLTAFNPYFILWWLTIGSAVIINALALAAILGVLIMYMAHVWMDYAFLITIAHMGKKGQAILGSKYYKFVLIAFGFILVYYGTTFLLAAINS